AVLGADREALRLALVQAPHRDAGVLPLLREHVEEQLETGQAVLVEQPLLDRRRLHAPQRLHAGVLRGAAAAQLLDDHARRQVVEVGLAAPGRARGAYLVVDPEPRAQDRRVADAAGDLEGEPARG